MNDRIEVIQVLFSHFYNGYAVIILLWICYVGTRICNTVGAEKKELCPKRTPDSKPLQNLLSEWMNAGTSAPVQKEKDNYITRSSPH